MNRIKGLFRRGKTTVERLYQAASPDHLRPRRGGIHSGNAIMDITQDKLRNLARYLDENHDLVVGVLDDLINNTIGDGRQPIPMVRKKNGDLADDVNKNLTELYQEWAERPDVTQQYGIAELERLAARSVYRDGEVFGKFIRDPRYGFPSKTKLAIEALEADHCPFEMNESGNGIIHGIQMDGYRRPIAYHFYDEHPGDLHLTRGRLLGKTRRIPAERVLHWRFVRRLNQIRGVPILHAVLNRLRDVMDYEESERIAARMAAELTGFIKRNGEFQGTVDASNRVLQMQSGAFFELMVGEDVGTIKSDRPNSGLADFRAAMLRAVSAGTGTRYSAIARDFNGTYSSQRQELVEAAVNYRALFRVTVNRWHIPIWREFVEASPNVFNGQVDFSTAYRVEYRPPVIPWIDMEKEAKAWKILLDSKIESHIEVMRARGRDPVKVMEELKREAEESLFIPPAPIMNEAIQDDIEEVSANGR